MPVTDVSKVRSIEDLPLLHVRWTARKKALVLEALQLGKVTRDEVRERYCMLEEELQSWERDMKAHGEDGLSVASMKRRRKKR